jgi:hypothetical protein
MPELSPHMLRIVLDTILFQEGHELFFEVAFAMMFRLILDVGDRVGLLRDSNGKGAVTLLLGKFSFECFIHPMRRRAFHQLHGLC